MLGSVEAVIERLEVIIDQAMVEGSPMGYFPALYRRVTLEVKKEIDASHFEDNERMEQLVIRFARYYLEAYARFVSSETTSRSWQTAFEQTSNRSLIVLQHLLLGMNAHISLDLGLAASTVIGESRPLNMKRDFYAINAILGSQIKDTQNRLTRIFRPLRIIDHLLGPVDEQFSLFSITYARDKAWTQTLELLHASPDQRLALEIERDGKVEAFSRRLIQPSRTGLRLLLLMIRMLERQDVSGRIRILHQPVNRTP